MTLRRLQILLYASMLIAISAPSISLLYAAGSLGTKKGLVGVCARPTGGEDEHKVSNNEKHIIFKRFIDTILTALKDNDRRDALGGETCTFADLTELKVLKVTTLEDGFCLVEIQQSADQELSCKYTHPEKKVILQFYKKTT